MLITAGLKGMKTNTIPVCSPLRLSMKGRLSTGEVQLQWPSSKRKQKQALKKKKTASSGTSFLERCTLTMIPEISARGSLIPAEPSTSPPRLNILSSHDSQWGRDLSAPKPFVTIPFQARRKPPDMLETFHRQIFLFVFQPTRRGVSRFISVPYQRLFTERGPTVHLSSDFSP